MRACATGPGVLLYSSGPASTLSSFELFWLSGTIPYSLGIVTVTGTGNTCACARCGLQSAARRTHRLSLQPSQEQAAQARWDGAAQLVDIEGTECGSSRLSTVQGRTRIRHQIIVTASNCIRIASEFAQTKALRVIIHPPTRPRALELIFGYLVFYMFAACIQRAHSSWCILIHARLLSAGRSHTVSFVMALWKYLRLSPPSAFSDSASCQLAATGLSQLTSPLAGST